MQQHIVENQRINEFSYNKIEKPMNNANCYAFETKAKYIYDSDEEEQYEFRGQNIIRTQKSMSLMSANQEKISRQNGQMKKSNSFLLSNKPQKSNKSILQSKDKSKGSKKCLNITEVRKKPLINSKNSMSKTSVSIGSVSGKSTLKSKKRSISKDFLILDEEIYQCDNIEEVNEKLICGNNQFYSHERFIKATLKNQQRLQTFITAFADRIKYSKKNQINISSLTDLEKKKLYRLLKSQTNTQEKERSKRNLKQNNEQFSMQNLIKEAVNKIEKKTNQIINQRPNDQIEARKWKNVKLHQLMAIHSCFKDNQGQSDRISDSMNNQNGDGTSLEYQSHQQLIKHQNFKSQQLKLNFKNMVEHPKIINKIAYKSEKLQQKQNKDETKLNFSLVSHSKQQNYPQKVKDVKAIKYEIVKYLPHDHCLSVTGIQNFLHDLWNYLVDSQLIGEFISKLRESYGLSEDNKKYLLRYGSDSGRQWTPYFATKINPVLRNEIFVQLCRSSQNNANDLSDQQRKSVLILQKAIFDSLNVELTKYQTDFPYGPFHPLENNSNNSAYLIDEENAMQVWEQCLKGILDLDNIGMGSLACIDSQQIQQAVKKHNQNSFKQCLINQKQLYMWEKTRPLATRKVFEQLMKIIQQQLFEQLDSQIRKF